MANTIRSHLERSAHNNEQVGLAKVFRHQLGKALGQAFAKEDNVGLHHAAAAVGARAARDAVFKENLIQ